MFSHSNNLVLELEKAKKAGIDGKKVVLFIGRGSKQGALEQDDSRIHFCFLSPLRENFLLTPQTSYSELITTLNKLPLDKVKDLFDEIIIDGGTLHHLIQELQGDTSYEMAALEFTTEIRFGDLFDTDRIAACSLPMVYQIQPKNFSYHELLLRKLAELSRQDLRLTFPFGEETPWKIGRMQDTARILTVDAEAQVKDLSLFAWYLMARKDCKFVIAEGASARGGGFLPKNADAQDLDSKKNDGALMFKGSLGSAAVLGLKQELKLEFKPKQ